MNKVKIGNEECMCIGCISILMEKVIGYLEFKNEELNKIIEGLIKSDDWKREELPQLKKELNFLKKESTHVEDLIKELVEFKEYNDEELNQLKIKNN